MCRGLITPAVILVPCQLAVVGVPQELSVRHRADPVQPATLVHTALSLAPACGTAQHALLKLISASQCQSNSIRGLITHFIFRLLASILFWCSSCSNFLECMATSTQFAYQIWCMHDMSMRVPLMVHSAQHFCIIAPMHHHAAGITI